MHPIVAAAVFVFCGGQFQNCSPATRDGFTRWAATEHGRALIAHLDGQVIVMEDANEEAAGRAPEPGIATLASMGPRVFSIVLNPNFVLPKGMVPLPGQPATPADMMAAAWAGEMLHIDFYSRGISLPHHQRDDFQQEWSAVAAELGFPALRHNDEDERQYRRRRAIVRVIGGTH
ncbi:MAG TPA: hypothetical protein VER58_13105 [Thermoanaerobaculia bacterium]|nr:hypothetical protein [Thermoanaerobaculia bacterium]